MEKDLHSFNRAEKVKASQMSGIYLMLNGHTHHTRARMHLHTHSHAHTHACTHVQTHRRGSSVSEKHGVRHFETHGIRLTSRDTRRSAHSLFRSALAILNWCYLH